MPTKGAGCCEDSLIRAFLLSFLINQPLPALCQVLLWGWGYVSLLNTGTGHNKSSGNHACLVYRCCGHHRCRSLNTQPHFNGSSCQHLMERDSKSNSNEKSLKRLLTLRTQLFSPLSLSPSHFAPLRPAMLHMFPFKTETSSEKREWLSLLNGVHSHPLP